MGSRFSDGLTLVLKALSVSRGQVAAAVGIDKSLVSRWCSGSVHPSAHNLARLTHWIAGLHQGFSLHDWEASTDVLAAKFGVAPTAAVPSLGVNDLMPVALRQEVAAMVTLHGAGYEGFWKVTRPSSEVPGQFIHDHVLIRRSNGVLGFRLQIMDIVYVGWTLPIQQKLFSIATDVTTGTFVFGIFNGVVRQRAEVIDGLVLTCMRDASATPIASKCLLERIADITDDFAADEATLARLAQAYPLSLPSALSAAVRDHVWSDTGPTALAAGGDTILMMALARSMSRGATYEDRRLLQPGSSSSSAHNTA